MEFNWLTALVVFVASTLLDAVFAVYIFAINKKQPHLAGIMSFFTYMLMAIGIVNYVQNKWYILPTALGAYLGTYGVVKYEIQKNKKPEK
jgi:hypothetical protein